MPCCDEFNKEFLDIILNDICYCIKDKYFLKSSCYGLHQDEHRRILYQILKKNADNEIKQSEIEKIMYKENNLRYLNSVDFEFMLSLYCNHKDGIDGRVWFLK